jgi:hypothetical protein
MSRTTGEANAVRQKLLQTFVDGQLMVTKALRGGLEGEGETTVTKTDLLKFCEFIEKKAAKELRRARYRTMETQRDE